MRRLPEGLRLSASDLANHLGCQHLTALDLLAADGQLRKPRWKDAALEVLQQRGFEHEAAYVAHLRAEGRDVVELHSQDGESAVEATAAAMRQGAGLIVQATLQHEPWFGRADILLRVERPSDLGDHSYEVVDTKLARETRAGTLLQLCLYSELVGVIQGVDPELTHVVSPGTGFSPESYRIDDFLAYYRFVRGRLLDTVERDAEQRPDTYPEPVAQCDICRWWPVCNQRRHDDDHLSLVAGITRAQRQELVGRAVTTLTSLGQHGPIDWRPERGAVESYEHVRKQAAVQLEGRATGLPFYRLLPREPERGLSRLPEPSPGDIFFDIEGDPFVGVEGLEYLLGWVSISEGRPKYHTRWAKTRDRERAAFEHFIDMLTARRAQYPGFHVYHYAPYEPATLKRLMGRYASREAEIDRMLAAGVFVDLHSVVKQALLASVERYSIKELEQFYRFEREVDLPTASKSLHAMERALELGQGDSVPDHIRWDVANYNKDDCLSTLYLRDWLEELRAERVQQGEAISRPAVAEPEEPKGPSEREERLAALTALLLVDVPTDAAERNSEQHARWLLAHLLEFHKREEKAPWWEYFRLVELDPVELVDENAGLGQLAFRERVGGTDACPVHRYSYPPQDSGIVEGDSLRLTGGDSLGTVAAIDPQACTVDIKKRADTAELHPAGAFVHTVVSAPEQASALLRIGDSVVASGIDGGGPYRAARDLLLRLPPRRTAMQTPLRVEGETTVAAARRLALELDHGCLPIQGPPGAGKTFTGARMIVDLVRAGKRVGITAMSHKVIRNLLDGVVTAAAEESVRVRCLQKVSSKAKGPGKGNSKDSEDPPIRETTKNKEVRERLHNATVNVVGGTAWLWAREELAEAVDVLVVDEAGQMSLANVLAVSQAAKSIVLLGDPQQLEQPLQGSHPEGTAVSALHHVLGDRQTVAEHQGLFLAETWRLHPDICRFNSELFYERRLQSRPNLERQSLVGESPFSGSGLRFLPVQHSGNQNTSPEEADQVAELWTHLTSGTLTWTDRERKTMPIGPDDVLIVAPYNAHVGAISRRVPEARVGTVDKFQGQEAPVVIYSMATSSPEDAPRGMEFLFSLNRLNVATSRARCVCILVANPRLFEPDCRTPRQMQLANAFCRYVEMARSGPTT